MKKSELKSIIREMIQEELSKMNEVAALQESTEVVTEDVETITEELPAAEAIKKEEPAEEVVEESVVSKEVNTLCSVDFGGQQMFTGTREECEDWIEKHPDPAGKDSGRMTIKDNATIAVEEAADGRAGASLVKANTYQNIAADIYNSPEFKGAFAIDGSVYGDEVNLVIEDALMSAAPSLSGDQFNSAVTAVTKYLSEFAMGEDDVADADMYSDDAFADLDKIYKDHFDAEGNLY